MRRGLIEPALLRVLAALWAALLLLCLARAAAAQDPVAAARELYASARYDEALAALNRVQSATSLPAATERIVHQYRSFCLLALGREDEAAAAMAAVVTSDPWYRPDEAEISPRIRTVFGEVRRELLPDIVRERYAAAKGAYDAEQYALAADGFRQVVQLLQDPDLRDAPADLKLLASGFLELSLAAAAAPPPPEPEPAPVTSPEAAGPALHAIGDPGVVPPVTIRQDVPRLSRELAVLARPRGVLSVVIDEEGAVESATMRASVHPSYDAQLIAAARRWRYRPATRAGAPVRFEKLIEITVDR